MISERILIVDSSGMTMFLFNEKISLSYKTPSPDGSGILFCLTANFVLHDKLIRQKRYSGQRDQAPENLSQQNENQCNNRRQCLNEKYFLRS